MGTARRNLRFRLIPAAKRARYRRFFGKLCKRYRHCKLPLDVPRSPRKLRSLFCRLMHKQYLAHELNARHRQHCLVLDKRVGSPGCSPGTIPSYFRKRILKKRFEEDAKEDPDQEEGVVVVDVDCDSEISEDVVLVDDGDTEGETKHPEIPDPTQFSVLKEEIKEYCAVQKKVHIVISMLKSRAEELQKDDEGEETEKVQVECSSLKDEPKELEAAELESLAEKYYDDSDEETTKKVVEQKVEEESDGVEEVTDVKPINISDDDDEVEEVDSKPEIVFVDTNALDDDSRSDEVEIKSVKPVATEEIVTVKCLKDISKSDLLDPTFSHIKLEPVEKKHSVVDSLFTKFNLKLPVTPPKTALNPPTEDEEQIIGRLRDRRKITSKPRYVEEDEPKKFRPSKIFDKIHKKLNLELDNTNSNSSTEFYGFDEGDVVKLDKPSVPGLLPTPIVKKSRPNAPFLAHGTTFEDIKIENRDDLFREEGLISFGSLPPRLECPRRPDDMVRPRTVAQKRILLQKKNDVRYLMIDNESKIFYELEKRSKNIDAELDFDRMLELQDQNIPFTRDTWRALAWLRTEKGKYFFQTMKIDNHSIKLSGCRGNHSSKKFGRKQLSAPATISRKHTCNCPELPANITVDLSAIEEPAAEVEVKSEPEEISVTDPEADKKLLCGGSTNRPTRYTRPGPLSSKFRYDSQLLHQTEDDAYLGPLEILQMPSVEIEVFPRIDRPLDQTVKPYLKMILPFRGITEKWARFAVSTLKTPDRNESDIAKEDRSFSFTLPYTNNQRRILIRRRVVDSGGKKPSAAGSLEKFERELKEPLTFRKHLDGSEVDEDKVDHIEKECADILSEMTDAVAISVADDLFVGRDPDGDYSKVDKPVNKPAASQLDSVKSNESVAKSKRMLREMKRLNATIIETIPEPMASSADEHKSHCDERYCSQGCICDVFSGKHTSSGNGVRSHCSKIDCVFECQCGYEKKRIAAAAGKEPQPDISEEGFSALTSEDVKYLREKATARLAKEERDFTPTVILTTNSTVLIRSAETESRRNKKKPKKYDDYYNENSVKSLLNGIIPEEDTNQDLSVERAKSTPAVGRPLTLLEKIQHAHVVLNKLHDLEYIEPWCMIHRLYRCYCRGNAIAGKPFKFNEESDIVLPTPVVAPVPDPLLQVYEPRRRRLYSFEKTEEVGGEAKQPQRKRDSSEESYKPWNERRKKKRRTLDDQSPMSPDIHESTPSSTRASIEDLQIHDGQTCRRAIPVNRNFYKTRNYYRKERFLQDIEEAKRKNPFAEKRLRLLLEKCERSFFEERKRELENLARKASIQKAKVRRLTTGADGSEGRREKDRSKDPIHIDIVGEDEEIRRNVLFSSLLDMSKVLIYCGKKKYYVELDAIRKGKVNLVNIAKKFRTTVYVLRRVTSDPLAKNISFSYRNELFTIKGRKYQKNQPYEQKDDEHVDLNANCESSDDQESTPSLVQETGTENDTQKVMLDQVNSDIVYTMQHIRDMLRKNTTKLNHPKKGILYLFRWEKFLQAFNEDLVDVWDITFQNGTDLVIITTENTRKNTPSFKNTKSVHLTRRCTFETKGVSLLTQMILYQIDNPETNKLALVLFGTENYWRFCGFIKAESDYLEKGCEVRPTPVSHPKLAPKINKYFEAFVASKKMLEETVVASTAKEAPRPNATAVPVEVPKPIKEETSSELLPAKSPPVPAKIAAIKSNVKLMETKIKDFKNVAIPNVGTRRWFMLNIVNDFSDIYIPNWKSCLTYGRIKQAVQLANRYKKTVKLSSIVLKNSQEDVLPQIYAAPGQGDCIFMGPYTYTQTIDLMLCQNVDGKMYTREEYERNNHIVRKEQTTGSWLYMKPNVTATATAATPAISTSPLPVQTKVLPPPRTATVTSTNDDDCVVIDDDDEPVQTVALTKRQEESQEAAKNNSQLESLIHQLYNESDSDEDTLTAEPSIVSTTHSTVSQPSVESIVPTEQTSKNQLSLLVEKTIAESKQVHVPDLPSNSAISNRRLSCIPAAADPSPNSPAAGENKQPLSKQSSEVREVSLLKRRTTGTVEADSSIVEVKKTRLSLPVTTTVTDEVVCLDDDDDDEVDEPTKKTLPTPSPKIKIPSSTTILNSQQAALIASKINLMNPNQKGVVYNPSTGVLRIKRSLMNSLTEGSSVNIPATSSSKLQSNSALATSSTPQKSPAVGKPAPSSALTPPPTPQPMPRKPIPAGTSQTLVDPPKTPTEGVLRSNIPGLGLVPVLWSSNDIILKVRELSVKQQFVKLANFEAAITLLNRFIRKNTYTFKPFMLTIGWKFEARATPLPLEENLINTISLRCIVAPDGVIDLYKASTIIAFQHTKPNFYEELLLLRLSILCCKKEQYEQEKCHKFFENIFIKATSSINELKSASEALTTQSTFLREQQEERRSYLAKLKSNLGIRPQPAMQMVSKRVSVPQSILDRVSKSQAAATTTTAAATAGTVLPVSSSSAAAPGGQKDAVIVIDDD